MKKTLRIVFGLMLIATSTWMLSGCGTNQPAEEEERGGIGKADLVGNCAGSSCNGKSKNGNCYCNESCLHYADCCEDYEEVCGGGTPEGAKLDFSSYEVLFTNPLCKEYRYSEPVRTADGQDMLTAKPKNVFCSQTDKDASASRSTSPQNKLVQWVSGLQEGEEIFLAYLSYSNSAVGRQLCDAARRGVKVTFVLDAPTDLATQLEGCGGTILLRGHKGGIEYAHNKIILVNPNGSGPSDSDASHMRIVFSSGNMSSGAVLHHENWHFIDVKRGTYFAEAHRCLMAAQLDETASASKSGYRTFLNRCRSQIGSPEESDIQAFFVPAQEDSQTITSVLVESIENAGSIDIGVHRFAYTEMVAALENHLRSDNSFKVRLVADDDLYWLKPLTGTEEQVGDNLAFEAYNVQKLQRAGGANFSVRYMETNHGSHLLHHNKFLIFKGMTGKPDAVLCGAANLTGAGFWNNFENIYYIQIPMVVDAFKAQYARFWEGQKATPDEQDPPKATPPEKMPERNILPQ